MVFYFCFIGTVALFLVVKCPLEGSYEDLNMSLILQISFDSIRGGAYKSVGGIKHTFYSKRRPTKLRDGSKPTEYY